MANAPHNRNITEGPLLKAIGWLTAPMLVGAVLQNMQSLIDLFWVGGLGSKAVAAVAMSAMDEMMGQFISGEAAKVFEQVRVPVISVNGSLWPINYEANRRHMLSYDAIVLDGADHFLMMNRPAEFNAALEQAIQRLLEQRAPPAPVTAVLTVSGILCASRPPTLSSAHSPISALICVAVTRQRAASCTSTQSSAWAPRSSRARSAPITVCARVAPPQGTVK